MAENTPAVPAASAPAPATPAAPVTPSQPKSPAPPLPKAQEQSTPPAAKTQPGDQKPKVKAERPAPTPEESANKLAEEMFAPKEAAPEPAKAPKTPETTPATPPAKETPPVAEKSPYAAMELPENATAKEQANFKKMKDTYEAEWQKAQNDRVARKELETYKQATAADLQEAQRLKTELQSAQDRLAVYDVSSHPDFQRQYTAPKKKALDEANMLLSDNAVANAPDMASLLSLPRNEFAKKVSELAAALPAFDQGALVTSMREAYRLNGEEKGALSKAGELKQSLAAKAAQEARVAFESSRGEFTKLVPAMGIAEGTSEPRAAKIRAYNEAREAAAQEAERYTFGRASDREVADIATRAAALNLMAHHVVPMLQEDLSEATEIIKAQTAELAAIKGKKNPGSFTAAEPPSATDTSKMDPRQLAEHMFKS